MKHITFKMIDNICNKLVNNIDSNQSYGVVNGEAGMAYRLWQ